jgi:hypothetical protein
VVDQPFDREERLAQDIVNPVVSRPTQAQSLSGDIALGQRRQAAMIEVNMAIGVKRASQVRRGLQPLSGQEPGPLFRAVVETQSSQLTPQAADFGNAAQTQQFAQFAWGLVLQLLDGLDAAQRHVGQQDNHVQSAVVAT